MFRFFLQVLLFLKRLEVGVHVVSFLFRPRQPVISELLLQAAMCTVPRRKTGTVHYIFLPYRAAAWYIWPDFNNVKLPTPSSPLICLKTSHVIQETDF